MVERYLDGFRTSDHAQILGCLTDDIRWTVFGAYRITGKEAYEANIENPEQFVGSPQLEVVRLVEQDDVVMGELTGRVQRVDGSWMEMAMGETWVMRDGLICERRTYLIVLAENDYR
jgi:ketosteroid isomerase-like protein